MVAKVHSTDKISGVLYVSCCLYVDASSGYKVIEYYHLHFTQEEMVSQKGGHAGEQKYNEAESLA